MLEVRVREAVSILPGPSRFQVHVCVCGGRGGCSNHGRALGTPNLTQDEQEYPRELLRGSVQTGACPQAAVWGSRMLELRPLPGAQVGFERPSVFESWLFLLLGLGLRTVPGEGFQGRLSARPQELQGAGPNGQIHGRDK